MHKLKRNLVKLLISLSVTISSAPARGLATCESERDELLNACGAYMNKAEGLISAQRNQITELKTTQTDLLRDIEARDKKIVDLSSTPWYRDNRTIFILGFIAGGVLYGYTNK